MCPVFFLVCFIGEQLMHAGTDSLTPGKMKRLLLSSVAFPYILVHVYMWLRHLGHLCTTSLNVPMQKGTRQQPATRLIEDQKKNHNVNYEISYSVIISVVSILECQTRCFICLCALYIYIYVWYSPSEDRHQTHEPGGVPDHSAHLSSDVLLTVRALDWGRMSG